jgi:hypothetical protein
MILQAAVEASKNTSAIFLDGVAIMALITAGGMAVREYIKTRRFRRNGNNGGNDRGPKPGTAPECREHAEKLIRLDEKWTGMKEDVVEMKADVKTLLERTAPKD